MDVYTKLDKTVTKIVQDLCHSNTPPEDIMDIKQDVLLSMVETYGDKLPEIAEKRGDYIYVHTRSRVIDHFRASSRDLLLSDDEDMIANLADDTDVTDEVLTMQVLETARNVLTPDEWHLLEMYYGLGQANAMTSEEIAEKEGVSGRWIRYRREEIVDKLHRALGYE